MNFWASLTWNLDKYWNSGLKRANQALTNITSIWETCAGDKSYKPSNGNKGQTQCLLLGDCQACNVSMYSVTCLIFDTWWSYSCNSFTSGHTKAQHSKVSSDWRRSDADPISWAHRHRLVVHTEADQFVV